MAAPQLLAAACLLAVLGASSAAYLQIEVPKTVPFNTSLKKGADDIPINDPQVAQSSPGIYPEQVSLTFFAADSIMVSWVTGNAQVGPSVIPPDPNSVGSVVYYGTTSALKQNATGYQEVYTQIHNKTFYDGVVINYASAIIHHVILTGLTPNTLYQYTVGDPNTGIFSPDVYNFTTLPATGAADEYPLRIGVMADLGQTANTSVTFDHLLQSDPQIVFLIADFTYADNFAVSGVTDPFITDAQYAGSGPGTYQPKWDTWGRLYQKIGAYIPFLHTNGNHEIELQANDVTHVSYNTRYPTPHNASGSSDSLYYSANVGPAHTVWLSSYIDFGQGSAQYQWFLADMAAVDRTKTPWVIVNWHAPWYNTYIAHYKENDCMRQVYEPIFYQYGVDISFLGHVHAYERTNPVYNYTVNQCGTVHITIGDGGNNEQLYTDFADTPGKCPKNNTPTAKGQPDYQPQFCPQGLFLEANGKFCPSTQPAYSAYREPSFGHGTLDILNATHAVWQWHRNQDPDAVTTDSAIIVRGAGSPAVNCATTVGPQVAG